MLDIQPVHRRTTARHAVALECEGVRESGRDLTTQHVLDLSPDGAFITTDVRDVDLGEELLVAFRAPDGDGWLYARAKVVRYGRESFRGDHVRGLGVRFIELAPEVHECLEQSLATVPPPVPTVPRPMDYASFVRRVDDGEA